MAIFKTRKDYYKETPYFIPTQPNPTERIGHGTKGDCVIRAVCLALNITWLEAYDQLCELGRKNYTTPNDIINVDLFCQERGFEKATFGSVRGERRMTAEDWAKDHPDGAYIVKVANHACAVVDGKVRDSWNSGNKCIYRVYKVR